MLSFRRGCVYLGWAVTATGRPEGWVAEPGRVEGVWVPLPLPGRWEG
jgi:hypothetical protein